MKKTLRDKLTYANVVSTLCLFLLLAGGTAFAATHLAKNSVGSRQLKKNSVTASKIKNGAITGAKVQASTLGVVPAAASAGSAATAATAATAKTAGDSNALGGAPASAYAKTQLEATHFVGEAGQPGFESTCKNVGSEFEGAGFYKDSFGIVHLVGDITGCPSGFFVRLFTLPPGFRPSGRLLYTVGAGETKVGELRIEPNGQIEVFSSTEPNLNGYTFRAG
jgi:hypothetical protein